MAASDALGPVGGVTARFWGLAAGEEVDTLLAAAPAPAPVATAGVLVDAVAGTSLMGVAAAVEAPAVGPAAALRLTPAGAALGGGTSSNSSDDIQPRATKIPAIPPRFRRLFCAGFVLREVDDMPFSSDARLLLVCLASAAGAFVLVAGVDVEAAWAALLAPAAGVVPSAVSDAGAASLALIEGTGAGCWDGDASVLDVVAATTASGAVMGDVVV